MKNKSKPIHCYKIMHLAENGMFKTLFHGVNGSKTIPYNTWIKAERKWAGEGNNKYWTGFHVLLSKEACEKYFEKFTDRENREVIEVIAKDLVPKESSGGKVFLAKWIMIPKND